MMIKACKPMRKFRLLLCLVTLIGLTERMAESQSNFGMWNTLSVEKEISKRFSACIEEELRLKDDILRLNLLYTEVGASYKPFKGFKLGLMYRLTEKYADDDKFYFRNRLMFDVSYKYHVAGFVIGYRSRVQSESENKTNHHEPEWFWRSKLELKYTIGKFTPFAGTELRYQIKVPRHPETDGGWHRVRYFVGTEYSFNKNNVVGIYYLKQHEFYILDPNNLDIVGLQYSVTLAHKKKHKKDSEKTE
jgi:hypothetical protein